MYANGLLRRCSTLPLRHKFFDQPEAPTTNGFFAGEPFYFLEEASKYLPVRRASANFAPHSPGCFNLGCVVLSMHLAQNSSQIAISRGYLAMVVFAFVNSLFEPPKRRCMCAARTSSSTFSVSCCGCVVSLLALCMA